MYHLDTGLQKMATERGFMAADLDMHAMAVDVAARSGDQDYLSKYLTLAETAAERADHRFYRAIAQRARGVSHRLSGELDQAARVLSAAADEFRAMETSWQVGRTLSELGEVEVSRGNPEMAREHYSEAVSAFKSLAATPYEERAREALKSLN